jgi:hypothetical protein
MSEQDEQLEFKAYLDRTQAEARDWYADAFGNAPLTLTHLAAVLADDDPEIVRSLDAKLLDCVQRLAGLKLHELTANFAKPEPSP